MEIKHYKDKKGNVYGYKPDGVAVTKMRDSEFKKYKTSQEEKIKDKASDDKRVFDLRILRGEHLEKMQISLSVGESDEAKMHALKIKEIDKKLNEVSNG